MKNTRKQINNNNNNNNNNKYNKIKYMDFFPNIIEKTCFEVDVA